MKDYKTQMSEYIDGWLNTVIAKSTSPSCGQKRDAPSSPILNWGDMPTPPSSETPTKSRRRLPKRQRQYDTLEGIFQDAPLDEQTPTGPTRRLQMTIPTRPFSNPPSLPSSSSTSNRSRSISPVKQSTLKLFKKPVDFVVIKKSLFRGIMQKTYKKISDIADGEKFIPQAVLEELDASDEDIRERYFFSHPSDKTQSYIEELAVIREIQQVAKSRKDLGASESAWNVDVHGPLMKLALKDFGCANREILTQARISPPFIPEMRTDSCYNIISSKMIDWGISVRPSASTAHHISKVIDTLPDDMRTINQTIYGPVRNDPIAVPIETKIATGHIEEARIQLALWVAAWHKRMAALRMSDEQIITLPLIIVMEHEWKLMFACDQANSIEIAEEINMGGTRDLVGLYRVIGILRELAKWMETEYLAWLDRWLGLEQPRA
ncbi:hypothetical protein H9Q70_003894 [Fusarium xylarioides]|nr:hypothetical protein H9Q70_003894 [Fusarium xylarioides]KAG5784064.1 hypothetical protein H9Q73_002263 [Fusarium xylarioides]